MTDKSQTTPTIKRGRKPIGETAMTAAERKRLSRARKAAEGRAEFMMSLGGGMLKFVDQIALATGYTRSQVVYELLESAIARMAGVVAEAEYMRANGASDEEVQAVMYEVLRTAPPPHLVEEYKEVLGLK